MPREVGQQATQANVHSAVPLLAALTIYAAWRS
jgi:hypothetical protein